MALPSAGNPISFKQINDELNNSSEATLDLKTASEELGEDTAPFGIDELYGLSFDAPAFTTALSATADSVDPSKVVLAWQSEFQQEHLQYLLLHYNEQQIPT